MKLLEIKNLYKSYGNKEVLKNINLEINYRASYPEQITGAAIRAYDYYNPEIEGIGLPLKINVK